MVTKKEEFNKLKWKYFWQQKAREVGWFVVIVVALIFVPYFLGDMIGDGKYCANGSYVFPINLDKCLEHNMETKTMTNIESWSEGLLYTIVGGVGLILLYLSLKQWIESNWKNAKLKAQIKVYGKSKVKKK